MGFSLEPFTFRLEGEEIGFLKGFHVVEKGKICCLVIHLGSFVRPCLQHRYTFGDFVLSDLIEHDAETYPNITTKLVGMYWVPQYG